MSRRARLGAGVLAVAILIGGCGANHASTQPVRNKVTETSDAPPRSSGWDQIGWRSCATSLR